MDITEKNLVAKIKKFLPFFICFLIFIFYLYIYNCQARLVTIDSLRWIKYGLQLFSGNLYHFQFEGGHPPFSPLIWMPGYPFFIGLTNLIFQDPIFSAYLVSIVSGTLLPLVVFYLSKELFNWEIGLISLLLCGFSKPMVFFAVSTKTRSTAMLFFVLSFYLLILAFKKKKIIYSILSGTAVGVAILIRFEFALYAILFGTLFLVYIYQQKIKPVHLICFSVSAIIIYSLYAYPLYKYSGFKIISPYIAKRIFKSPIPIKPNLNIDIYKKLDTRVRSVLFNKNTAASPNIQYQKAIKVSQEDFDRYGTASIQGTSKFSFMHYKKLFSRVIPQLLGSFWIFFILGCFYCIHEKNNSIVLLLLIIVSTLLFYSLISTHIVRYFSHLKPLLLIISSCGLYLFADYIKTKIGNKHIFYLIILSLIAACIVKDVYSIRREYTTQTKAWLKSAEYLRNNADEDSIVMARRRYHAFYSGLRTTVIPDEQLKDTWEYANHIGADYIIINALTSTLMPQYEILLKEKTPTNLELCEEFFKQTEFHTRIFKIKN
jgi:4-amino-4-deoxy-L-arabinose transferase-like glycosyltransferase